MVVGLDNSPLVSTHKLAHKIRGSGFYIKNLLEALEKYHPEHKYVTFTQGEKLNSNLNLFHYPYFEPFFLSLPFKKRGKTIITIHDLTPLLFPEMFSVGMRGRVKYQIQKFIAKNADAVITDSNSSKKDIEKLMGIASNKVFSVPLAAAPHFKILQLSSQDKKKISEKYGLSEKFALYVGDATPNKNLRRLIDAVQISGIPLVMAGGALAKKDVDLSHPWNVDLLYVKQAVEKNSNVKILGFVPDDELVELYNMARVFVFPSLYEGFGLPLLEAAACGCPIITSDRGSIPEVMGSAAIYVNPEDINAIAMKLTEMFTNDNLHAEYVKKGIAQSEMFSWEKTADKTVSVYEKVFKEA